MDTPVSTAPAFHPAPSLHAVSLQEYEALVSGREAFISFLLGDPAAAA